MHKNRNKIFELTKKYAQMACKNVVQKECELRTYLTPWATAFAEEQLMLMNDY